MQFYSIWIAAITIFIFLLQQIIPGFTELFILDSNSFIQPWKFITAIFLHGSLAHLMGNLFAMLFFGIILEKVIGSKRFLIIYFTTGILANLIAINFYSSSLGASGAIMGIIGTLAILRPGMQVWAFGVIMPMFIAAIVWVAVDAIGVFIPSNTGHIAHLSGIAFGIILGWTMRKKFKIKEKKHKISIPDKLMKQWESTYMDN